MLIEGQNRLTEKQKEFSLSFCEIDNLIEIAPLTYDVICTVTRFDNSW